MSLQTQINTLNSWCNECRIILYNLEDDLDWRLLDSYNKGQHGGIGWVTEANRTVIAQLIEAMQYFVYGHSSSFNYVYWINVHQGLYDQESELSLVAMIEAYITADDDARSAQRLLFDAYQASMYDKPFDMEYHSDWVRRFRSWA